MRRTTPGRSPEHSRWERCCASAAGAQAAGFDDTFGVNGTVFTSLSAVERPLPERHARPGRRDLQRRLHDGRRHRPRDGADPRRRRRRARRAASATAASRSPTSSPGPYAAPPAGNTPDRHRRDRARRRRPARRQDRHLRPGRDAAGRRQARQPRHRRLRRPLQPQRHARRRRSAPAASSASTSPTASAPATRSTATRPTGSTCGPTARSSSSPPRASTAATPAKHRPRHRGRPAADQRRARPSFGTDGVAITRNAGVSENPRQGLVQADGKIVATALRHRASATPTRPFLFRFNADGTTDTSVRQRRRRHG